MREIYVEILRLLARRAEDSDYRGRVEIGNILVHLNNAEIPLDQDIIDFLSEFYVFLVFGYNSARADAGDAIRNWEDLRHRLNRVAEVLPARG